MVIYRFDHYWLDFLFWNLSRRRRSTIMVRMLRNIFPTIGAIKIIIYNLLISFLCRSLGFSESIIRFTDTINRHGWCCHYDPVRPTRPGNCNYFFNNLFIFYFRCFREEKNHFIFFGDTHHIQHYWISKFWCYSNQN